jgi:nucleotide-binding universal stress UspA family protein
MISGRDRFVRVVVGADGSDGSRHALEWAAHLSVATGAQVLAVHVLTYNHEFAKDLSLDTMRTWRSELRHELETRWTQPLTVAGAEHRCLIVEDDSAAAGLLKTCENEQADLIVVGAKGHRGFGDRILGGVSYRVTHAARLPVVIVPPEWG